MQHSASTDLSDIRAFLALAEGGSFAAAARQLARDATVLSRRVSHLEEQLGVRLVERTTRRIALTEAGKAYLARVRPLLQDLDAANREALSYADGEPRGLLRLALPTTFGRMWLAPLILSFLQRYPKVRVQAEYTNRIVDLIGEGFDLAIRLAELPDSRLIARKVADRRRLVCAAPSYLATAAPIRSPEDLSDHSCLLFTGRTDTYHWIFNGLAGERLMVPVLGSIISDDADLLLDAAIAGMGIFLTTDWHVGPALVSGELVELLREWPTEDAGAIYVVTPAAGGTPNKTQAFSDWVAQGLRRPPWKNTSKRSAKPKR